ncbi:simple sugar transport system permease protein [Tindallia magadiensis]|uniref:Simple sugar transport system permease protein n=1 Tax=Tindallia magadiensis TaxID=69895 RepID=A0A1I3EK62_9FIRM|nr:ABC transporter permease [Tindallia magadiensis]SFH99374.1 simple sugar transport system permease protein [Tindallia magadiensis]
MENQKIVTPPEQSGAQKVKQFIVGNMVTILFVIICWIGFYYSGLTFSFLLDDVITRMVRNSFLVLALLLPVMAGMGLNFAIVLGAMCAQAAVIMVTHWEIPGMKGIFITVLLTTPLAILLGYLTGKLFNRTKGQEMITGLILGFFSNGIYQFIFLLLLGSVIPFENETLVLSSGVGLRTTVDLAGGLRYAIDDVWYLPFTVTAIMAGIAAIGHGVYRYLKGIPTLDHAPGAKKYLLSAAVGALLIGWSFYIRSTVSYINFIKVPVLTVALIALLCLFTSYFVRTKLGQDFRTVGQDRHIAQVSGIHSDNTRLLAMILSTTLASWGHIIFLQNLGTFSTYGSHEQIGLYSVAALLIGGASVTNAKISHALLGTFLFHTLFIVSPLAGRNLFGDAQLGEYFRVFVAYGVIGLSLVMHAWKKQLQTKKRLS